MKHKAVFINGIGSISCQGENSPEFLLNLHRVSDQIVFFNEPDYSMFIDKNNIRRMGKLMKSSLVAAIKCANEANAKPDAIITGTGMGCMEDTVKFAKSLIEDEGGLLSPTSFIHSTHNTIGSQIAIYLNCNGYNSTYVHRNHSFEQALKDAMMQIQYERSIQNVLVGGTDEMVSVVNEIINVVSLMQQDKIEVNQSYSNIRLAPCIGEGINYFMLSSEVNSQTYAELEDLKLFYKTEKTIIEEFEIFLNQNEIEPEDIDLILLGNNGCKNLDEAFYSIERYLDKEIAIGYFKHFSGEFFTSTAFGMTLSLMILKYQFVPNIVSTNFGDKKIKKILMYNQYNNLYHSFYLFSKAPSELDE